MTKKISIYRMRCAECEFNDECRPASLHECKKCNIDDVVGIKHANVINNKLHMEMMNNI